MDQPYGDKIMKRCLNKIFHFDDDDYEVNQSENQRKEKIRENAKTLAQILLTRRG